MSTYADLIARLVPTLRMSMQRVGAPEAVDEGYMEQCMLDVLGEVADVMDLDALTIFDTPLFATASGVRTYALPNNFGRGMTFREPRQTGIRVNDGTTEYELRKEQMLDFVQGKSSSTGRPATFIMTAGGMTLDPAPDSNGSVGYYMIRGTYQQKLDFNSFDFEQEVLLQFPQALQDATMARYLGQDTAHATAKLINGEMRQKQEFQWEYTPSRYRRWRRRGRY